MKKAIHWSILVTVALVLIGCMPSKEMQTESGKELPKSFVKLYQYVGLADGVYWDAKEALSRADEKGLVKEEYKDEIVSTLEAFNDVKMSTRKGLEEWYKAVDQGRSVDSQKVRAVVEGMSELVKQSNQLQELIAKATDGKVDLQSNLAKQLNETLSGILKSKVGGN